MNHLIEADARRRRHRAWALMGTGVAAALAAVLVAPTLLADTGAAPGPAGFGPPPAVSPPDPAPPHCTGVSPKPTGPQPPTQSYDTARARPTESPADGVARLTGAFRDTLRTALPPGVRVEPAQKSCAEPQFQYHPSYREYSIDATLRRGDDFGFFLLRVSPTGTDRSVDDVCSDAPPPENERSCEIENYPDGSAAVLSIHEDVPGGRQLRALVHRAEGNSVLVITNNIHNNVVGNKVTQTLTADEPLLTMDQLVAIARAPGLTLYP
ncbi:hypothetical protein GA0070607_2123 [Micromonospora coriariae]|uniref:Uncharacterized protein n=1 Tax=Micromonospora coriariae TaxID=285665 RepID=A0A1C4VH59_9ACTN|nr:hypothetical protein [Micromonospora coriariae]SCE83307.1 hypothetical protein GA0070607_2123 [Micromonospora coriariae]